MTERAWNKWVLGVRGVNEKFLAILQTPHAIQFVGTETTKNIIISYRNIRAEERKIKGLQKFQS